MALAHSALLRKFRHTPAKCLRALRLVRASARGALHVIPLSQGGDHILANVQSLCLMCNSIKGARLDVTQSHEGVGGDPQEPQVKRPLGRWLAVQTPELSIGGDRQ